MGKLRPNVLIVALMLVALALGDLVLVPKNGNEVMFTAVGALAAILKDLVGSD